MASEKLRKKLFLIYSVICVMSCTFFLPLLVNVSYVSGPNVVHIMDSLVMIGPTVVELSPFIC